MDPRQPAWEYQSFMWECPEPTMPPGLNREEAWAWAMDNFPALCRRSYAPRLEAKEAHPPACDDPSCMWGRPKPTMPPGLNREEAWAWAMDNFPALCRPSCAPRPEIEEPSCGAHGLLRPARAGAQRGQKPCRDPLVHDPQAEFAEDPQPPRRCRRQK